MLKSLLSANTCAACRNCCVFEPQSAWELPTFSAKAIDRLRQTQPTLAVTPVTDSDRYRITLPYDESGSAQPCPFLDPNSGCTLPAEEKPFACSLWPIRVMEKDGRTMLTLYRGCDGLPEEKIEAVRALLEHGLRTRIMQEAESDPTLILPYHSNYAVLEESR